MSSIEALLNKASEYVSPEGIKGIQQAYNFAEESHRGQLRLSGEPFVEHPLQTAIYLSELHLDSAALSAALLHDVIEDCGVSYGDIEKRFGHEIATLVDGVTKLTKTEFLAEERRNWIQDSSADEFSRAANLKKMLKYISEDVRVVLIKLADRMHNMRTLDAQSEGRRSSIAQETLDIYAPLAHRLGIWEVKWLLEDLSFQYINPVAYKEISKFINLKRNRREAYVERIRKLLVEALSGFEIEAEVTGRPKHIYSVHKKMELYSSQNKKISDIYDLFALRIIVDDVQDCYAALGVIHAKWRPLPGQFDDYIANPKDNLYQSLHTAVLCEEGLPVEIQIRTKEMHKLAEYGVAAHWLYKEGEQSDPNFEKKMVWLRQVLEWQRDIHGAQEFVESFKTDIFNNQVFVYTPQGELKELPVGSTTIDFAYRIHTEIGHKCVGARVNGILVPLETQLNNGDTVEIVTSKSAKGPPISWLNIDVGYVKTASARAKIRQWYNRQTRKSNIENGRRIESTQLRRLYPDWDNFNLSIILDIESKEEFLGSLGKGEISVSDVIKAVSNSEDESDFGSVSDLPDDLSSLDLQVSGVGELYTRIATCCSPSYGDDISGYITSGRTVSIHTKDCSRIVDQIEAEGLVDVDWGKNAKTVPVKIKIEALDRVGLLGDITGLVSSENVNIGSCISDQHGEKSMIYLTILTNGIDQLSRLFSRLEGVEGVVGLIRDI